MSDNFNKNRIFKNTFFLYGRMLITMGINLYTTRLVLANLGVDDMGVYGVVGSITSLFIVLIGGITNAIQRFITFELGRKDGDVNIVFCSSLNILFITAFIFGIILELGGLWVLNNKVNIPPESMDAAFWVFQLSILTCLIDIISIPYNALVVAYERMGTFAIISILQVVLTCMIAYSLSLFEQERLLIYAILMAAVSILIRVVYQVYCRVKFVESRYRYKIDRNVLNEIRKYAEASTVSSFLYVISRQGIVFVINWIFGVAVNAVYGIAQQLKNSFMSFSFNISRAISPQITKTYASEEFEVHKKLVYSGCKMQVFCIYFILIPFLVRTEYIMELWLGDVPQHAVFFARCIIFVSLAYSLSEPLGVAVLATKRIKAYLIVPELFYLLVLVVGYIVGQVTDNPDVFIFAVVCMEVVSCCLRIYWATKVTLVKMHDFLFSVIFPCIRVGILSGIACYGLDMLANKTFWGLLELLVFNTIILIGLIYLCGLNQSERIYANSFLNKMISMVKIKL